MEDLKQIFVEHQIKTVSEVDVILWAEIVVESAGPLAENPNILELASLNKSNRLDFKRVGPLLTNAIEETETEFSLNSPEAERYAQEGFYKQCQRLVEGSIAPYDLCRCVFPIESLFRSPKWLGMFPKLCEPIEPGTPAEAVPDLVRLAERFLSA